MNSDLKNLTTPFWCKYTMRRVCTCSYSAVENSDMQKDVLASSKKKKFGEYFREANYAA